MQFNSPEFIVFLFTSLLLFFGIKNNFSAQKILIVFLNFVFYAFWSTLFLFHLLAVVLINYLVSEYIFHSTSEKRKKVLLITIIIADIANLFIFKYANLAVDSINWFSATTGITDYQFLRPDIVLPLAISFYTFQMISYLVDVYRHQAREASNAVDFFYYVTFFPQLIAGPIVRPKEFFPQYRLKVFDKIGFFLGLNQFVLGLFQKAVIGDNLAIIADHGFEITSEINNLELYIVLVAYSFQIFFDFSGYSNMAIGSARMFGYNLPPNFQTPYLATNISLFWRRWHMTLSRWITDYIFIPLGGSRGSMLKTGSNMIVTMALGGLWHGASWTFMVWGLVHGVGLAVHRIYKEHNIRTILIKILSEKVYLGLMVLITFHFVTFSWIFFRSPDFGVAWQIISQLFTLEYWHITSFNSAFLLKSYGFTAMFIYGIYIISTKTKIICEYFNATVYRQLSLYLTVLLLIILLSPENSDPFIYFQF